MDNSSNARGSSWDDNDCGGWVFTENSLFICSHSISFFSNSTKKYGDCSSKVFLSIIFIMNNVQQKVAISPHKFNFFRIYGCQFLIYILNYFIVLWNLRPLFLQYLSINLILKELPPEALGWKSCHIFVELIFLEKSLILKNIDNVQSPRFSAVLLVFLQ